MTSAPDVHILFAGSKCVSHDGITHQDKYLNKVPVINDGEGAVRLQNGKIAGLKLVCPPSVWLKLQAPVLKQISVKVPVTRILHI